MKPNIAIELIDCLPDIEKSIEVLRVIEHACIKKRNEIRSHLRERKQATAEQRRKAQAELNPLIEQWVENNVRPGMFLKMKGTRDGHGIREVLSVKKKYGRHPVLVCHQIQPPSRHTDWELEVQQITEHDFNKVMGTIIPLDLSKEEVRAESKRGGKGWWYIYRPIKEILKDEGILD